MLGKLLYASFRNGAKNTRKFPRFRKTLGESNNEEWREFEFHEVTT